MKLHCRFRVMMQAIPPSRPKKKEQEQEQEQREEKRNAIFFRRYEGM